MSIHILKSTTIINQPLTKVFDFFSKAENLDKLTPTYLKFRIVTPLPIDMKPGALITYQLKLYGIPFSWTTKITKWEPPYLFEDSQLKGPYKTWIHEHRFEEIDGKVHMYDYLQYESPGWFLEPLINAMFVKANVHKIFEYREKALKAIFK